MRRSSAALALLLTVVAPAFCALNSARADVKLPSVISDNMVIQADKPVSIWGSATPDEKVTVTIGADSGSAVAGADGKWKVLLKPIKADTAVEITVKGKNELSVKNAIVGSVWICSGQSNMAFGINGANNAVAEMAKADYPKIRLYYVTPTAVLEGPQTDVHGEWLVCSPKSLPVSRMSAVAYFFARDIHQATGTPVGLIDSAWGGTPAQSWVSIEGLKKDPELKVFLESIDKTKVDLPRLQAMFPQQLEEYNKRHEEWKQASLAYEKQIAEWTVKAEKARQDKTPEPPKPAPIKAAPTAPKKLALGAGTPSVLYNGMIAPFIPMPIEGAIWYQGESNAGAPDQYKILFPRMITDWREKWGQGDFPFYFVQLANFMQQHDEPLDTNWARLREAQFQTLKLPHTGMAVIIDIGDGNDIHPKDKSDVGHRLAQWALRDVYGKKVVVSGPLYSSMKTEPGAIRISFTQLGSGLTIGSAPSTQPSVPRKAPLGDLVGFQIAGEDKKFVWAKAVIDGETIVVSSDKVANPVAVRYAWDDNPACNLYNKEGIPASPFRTDNFESTVPIDPKKAKK